MKAAELAAKLGAARSEHHRNVNATRDSQINSCAAPHRLEAENVASAGLRSPPWRDCVTSDLCLDLGACERESHIFAEAEPERRHRDFNAGGVVVVCQEDIAGAQRDIVHCA